MQAPEFFYKTLEKKLQIRTLSGLMSFTEALSDLPSTWPWRSVTCSVTYLFMTKSASASVMRSMTCRLHDLISTWPSQHKSQWCTKWPTLHPTLKVSDFLSDLISTGPRQHEPQWRIEWSTIFLTLKVRDSTSDFILHGQFRMSLDDGLSDLPSTESCQRELDEWIQITFPFRRPEKNWKNGPCMVQHVMSLCGY